MFRFWITLFLLISVTVCFAGTTGKEKNENGKVFANANVTVHKDNKRVPGVMPSSDRTNGGPDAWGYTYLDSYSIGGPEHNWVDISAIGTSAPIQSGTVDDGFTGEISLGYSFPYYDNYFDSFKIGSNGFITFNTATTDYAWSNSDIPNSSQPNNIIAPFWDDLISTNIRYYNSAQGMVIAWLGSTRYDESGQTYTFEAILHTNGNVEFSYQAMGATLSSSTTGIENSDGSIGLKAAYNSSYLSSNLTVLFTYPQPNVHLLNPNTGGTFYHGSICEISWEFFHLSSPDITLQYTTDNGMNWNLIDEGLHGTSYAWEIPYVNSTQCLVRVFAEEWFSGHSYYDQSDWTFTIGPLPHVINLLQPNGGEALIQDSTYVITWSTQNITSTETSVYFSSDNGSTWEVPEGTPGDHSFAWIVPHINSTTCLVKVYNTDFINSYSATDVSNAVFSIIPLPRTIHLLQPNGGEALIQDSTYVITWSTQNITSPETSVYFSSDNGSTWEVPEGTPGDHSFAWIVPHINSTTCLVKVYNTDFINSYSATDVSNAVFSIIPLPRTIHLLQPNGGVIVYQGITYEIQWETENLTGYIPNVYFSSDNGTSWEETEGTYGSDNHSFLWLVPYVNSTQCLIKLDVYDDITLLHVWDTSDAVFEIAPPPRAIHLLQPNGGETLYQDDTYEIRWETAYISDPGALVYYSPDNGSTWEVAEGTIGSRSFAWTVPHINSTDCLVKVYNTDIIESYHVTDISDAVFTITQAPPSISVLQPNGSEELFFGSTYRITWNIQHFSPTSTMLYYSIDNGLNWVYLTITTGMYYDWTVPDTESAVCLVKVVAINGMVGITDISNSIFYISPPPPSVTLIGPNGGETLRQGQTYEISWSVYDFDAGNASLSLSEDNGMSWTLIGDATGTTYSWTVPTVISDSCLIRVEQFDISNMLELIDISNNVFSITVPEPSIVLVQPNGGEDLASGSTYRVTWNIQHFPSASSSLYYSTDNGLSWNFIANTTDSYYDWSVPSVESTECLVKVIAIKGMAGVIDISNSAFTIHIPIVPLTAPPVIHIAIDSESGDVTLTWSASDGNPTGYFVYRSNEPMFLPESRELISTRTAAQTFYTDANNIGSPIHFYRVSAYK